MLKLLLFFQKIGVNIKVFSKIQKGKNIKLPHLPCKEFSWRTAIENIYFHQIIPHYQNNFCMNEDIKNIYYNLKAAMSHC